MQAGKTLVAFRTPAVVETCDIKQSHSYGGMMFIRLKDTGGWGFHQTYVPSKVFMLLADHCRRFEAPCGWMNPGNYTEADFKRVSAFIIGKRVKVRCRLREWKDENTGQTYLRWDSELLEVLEGYQTPPRRGRPPKSR